MRYAVLAGRQLFSIIFIVASAGHFSPDAIESAARHGVPLPDLLVPVSGVIALVGGLSVLLGFQTRIGAWLLVLFLVPVTAMMHNFWTSSDPLTHQIERAMFLKNVTMLGGALVISYFGAGPLSLDSLLNRDRGVIDETEQGLTRVESPGCTDRERSAS
jgi:putative oxidoreductase